MMWFGEFKNFYRWDEKDDDEVFELWQSKGATVVRQTFADIRRGKCKGRWLASTKLEALRNRWKYDPKFKEVSERNKKNLAANKDGKVNRGGAISFTEHKKRYEVKLGRKVSISELYESMNYDGKADKWYTPHSEMLYDKFKEMKEDFISQGKEIDDSAIFFEAAGGTNRHGRCHGFGSEAIYYATSSGSRNSSKGSQSSIVRDEHLMNDRLNRLEDANAHLKDVNKRLAAEVAELRNLILQKNNTEKNHAVEATQAKIQGHFHTIQISSLSPASICAPSQDHIKKRPSTLEVFHRHGPCSKLGTTTRPVLKDVLSQDQSRVDWIHGRLNPNRNPTTTKIKDTKANLPAKPGISLGSGNYIVSVSLGSPKKSLSLIFDTGSDLTWTQCQPCARSCYKQQDPIFDPSSSTSYTNITCTSPTCSQVSSATGNSPRCSGSTCVYTIQYGDQSFSVGYLSKDTLTITSDVFTNFQFGCGQNNQGLFGKTAGLIGLGRDPLSIVSQTAAKYGKYFSYCLPSSSSSTGHLTLGRGGAAAPPNVKFTPFDASQGSAFYYITIVSISVGGSQLPIGQSVFQTAGTIIDSGTVITRLPPAAYGPLSAAFKQQMKKYPAAPAYSLLDTCFDLTNYTSITIPTVAFGFGGGVKVDLSPSGILVAVSSTQACLAFAGNSDAGDVGIFGNTQQTTFEVVYDVAGGKLGFGVGGC
ncbi:Eukaryotic aspartyl protease family protein [Perilla frutescens var. hirtella]|nr:Eukaryotic aspartyl protease family protein [Perilla frutescens var. hirtella]